MQAVNAPDVSHRAADMPRSSIRRLFNAAAAMQAQGVDVIRLDIGDPDFALPPRMANAITDALSRGQTHYSPMPGLLPLREAAARHVTQRMAAMSTAAAGQQFSAEQTVINQGATQALNACLQLTCDRRPGCATAGDLFSELYAAGRAGGHHAAVLFADR